MSPKPRSSAAMRGKKPPPEKKKKPSPATEQISIFSLPNELVLNCIARVSRLYYPTLSFVSKTFRSIVASPELYETRSRLNRTEKCLYVCLHFPSDTNTYWFSLCRQPDRKITDETSGYHMFQVPSPSYLLPAKVSSLVAVGSNIYKIGGADSFGFEPWKRPTSSRVSVLDCRSHTWHKAPSMRMKRGSSATSSFVNEKIYVAGGCKDKHIQSSDWIEVFDLKTQTWDSVKNPRVFELHDEFRTTAFVAKSLGLEGKLYMAGDDMSVYDPEEAKWEWKEKWKWSDMFWAVKSSHCVINDVLFYWVEHKGVFKWYDSKVSSWKQVHGVEGLPDMSDRKNVKTLDLGGKIAVLWDEVLYTETQRETRIWCSVIGLERRDGDEIWGKVEWLDFLLRAHFSCSWFDALSATV